MEHGIPFLEACSTIEGIGRSIASGALKKALVYWQVKDLVHVPDQ
jgi:hypothetical protein